MANDWSDPERVERELERRKRGEPPGGDAPSDMRLLLAAMLAVLKAQKRTDTLTEDIATLRGVLDLHEPARSVEDQPAAESGLAQQLAEAEGRIAGQVDILAERVRAVADTPKAIADTPKAIKDLAGAVRTLDEAVRAQTVAAKGSSSFLNRLSVDLKDMVRNADLGMRHRFADEAKGVREALQETAAVVRTRRSRSRRFWLGLAGAVLLGLLVCFGLGVWLQSKYGLAPAHDPTGGWRDYLWQQYGSAIVDCTRKAEASGRPFDCRLSVPPPPR